jgi:hypothetical protein
MLIDKRANRAFGTVIGPHKPHTKALSEMIPRTKAVIAERVIDSRGGGVA